MKTPHLGPTFAKTMLPTTQGVLSILSILEEYCLFMEGSSSLQQLFTSCCSYIPILLQEEAQTAAHPLEKSLQEIHSLLGKNLLSPKEEDRTICAPYFRSLFLELYPFFEKCKKNENLLLYLLEHQSKLDAFLGEKMVKNLLTRLFPEGKMAIQTILISKYAARGFTEIVQKCNELLSTL